MPGWTQVVKNNKGDFIMAELKNKRIITVALTGAWPKKENNPNVPMTPA